MDGGTTLDAIDNTITQTQGYGIIYQEQSEGNVTGNTVYDNEGRVHIFSGFHGTIDDLSGNVMVGTRAGRLMFSEGDGRILGSDCNCFIQPYGDSYISMQDAEWVPMTLAEWRAFSGEDTHSVAAWFTSPEGTEPRTELFINDTAEEKTFALDGAYLDLDQQAVPGSITLAPFSSRVLVLE